MEVNTFLRSPVIFFISRLLILIGMVLFFTSVSMGLSFFLCKPLFGVDVLGDISALKNYSDPNVINALKFIQVMWVAGAFMIPAFYFPKALQQHPKSFLQVKAPKQVLSFALAIGIIILSMPLISWLVYLNEHISLPASLAQLEERLKAAEAAAAELTKVFMAANTTGDMLLNIFVLAVMPAIAEELLFRGALLQFIRFCFGNVHLAVIVSAIIFSAFHGQFYGFVPRAVLGMLLGYIFVYSGSLWPGILVHFLNNALALLTSWNHWDEAGFAFMREDYVFPLWVNLLSLAATAALVWLMGRTYQKTTFSNGE